MIRRISKKHLLNDYRRLKKTLGRRPTLAEFRRHHEYDVLCKVFGKLGWRKLLKANGEKPLSNKKLTREHLIKDYKSLKKKLGRPPTRAEYEKKHHDTSTLQKAFHKTGWNSLLNAAGEKPRHPTFVTRDVLIREYQALKKKLGKQPTSAEYEKECYGQWHVDAKFGRPGWRRLVEAAGDTPRLRVKLAREHLIKDYFELKEELGRSPTAAEYEKRHHSITTLRNTLGGPGWFSLREAAGEKPKQRRSATSITSAMLLEAYHALKKKLGKQPTSAEYEKECYGQWHVTAKFGTSGWTNLVHAAGDKPLVELNKLPNITAEHLIEDFLHLQEKLGRRPMIGDYLHHCHTPKVLDRVFGKSGWKRMIESLGEKAMPKGPLTPEHLIKDYLDAKEAFGREPAYAEFRMLQRHTRKVLDRVFGKPGWQNLREAASGHPAQPA